jgi:hypothetical protein
LLLDAPTDLVIAGDTRYPLEDLHGRKPVEEILRETESPMKGLPESFGGRQWSTLQANSPRVFISRSSRIDVHLDVFDLAGSVLKLGIHHHAYSPCSRMKTN